jgi:hypothetical protein
MNHPKTLDEVEQWEADLHASIGNNDDEYLPPGSILINDCEEEPRVKLVSGIIVQWDNCHDIWYEVK